ncbi:GntR family transcriptional regulator [Dethiosulfatarculus sandiegensis]|uniref:GntR family transcriptional regulator n=1 Tax=Dethiosulfatarculus sandiegensis TaxID=1429043 RepID=A0A0D2HZR9_9BACT|nr:GntR family transcriptional regulator [Dethiosulfatarculus sandiegensis]
MSQTLVEAILDRKLKGGDRLVETELQKHFKVSRTPLREALRDLEKKGLVVIKPRRGTFVKEITRKDIFAHYPVQASLEGLAAREAHRHINPTHCLKMENSLKAMEQAAQAGDTKAFLEHHAVFHTTFITACKNQLLIDMITELRFRGDRLRYFFPYTQDYCLNSVRVHWQIKEELCSPDTSPDKVEKIVREHIERLVNMEGWGL